MTDPIADMLTRIRNGLAINLSTIDMPHSTVKEAIVKTLIDAGFLEKSAVSTDAKGFKVLSVTLKYAGKNPTITKIQRISKPGRRVYMRSRDLETPLSGYGVTILTTSQGIMTEKEARKRKLGGEIICQVY